MAVPDTTPVRYHVTLPLAPARPAETVSEAASTVVGQAQPAASDMTGRARQASREVRDQA